jgi:hypothetical protein
MTDTEFASMLDYEGMPMITSIDLMGNKLGADAARTIVTHPKTRAVKGLHLSINPIGNEGLRHLAAWSNLDNVTYLYLADANITDAAPISNYTGIRLDLSGQDLSKTSATKLASIRVGALTLRRAKLPPATLRRLLEDSQAIDLILDYNPSDGSLVHLKRIAPQLESLSLRQSELSQDERMTIQRLWGQRANLKL